MKKSLHCLPVLILLFSLCGCFQSKTEGDEVLCEINEYKLPVDDFHRQLAEELEFNSDFKLTQKAKREFLEQLIKKELLIQEAKKLKLDRQDKFIRTIERHWESTLIRDLMDLKGEEISMMTYVSEEEIKTRYKEMAKLDNSPPCLSEIHDQIREELREKKRTQMITKWINDLRRKASIVIYNDLL